MEHLNFRSITFVSQWVSIACSVTRNVIMVAVAAYYCIFRRPTRKQTQPARILYYLLFDANKLEKPRALCDVLCIYDVRILDDLACKVRGSLGENSPLLYLYIYIRFLIYIYKGFIQKRESIRLYRETQCNSAGRACFWLRVCGFKSYP